MRRLGYRPYPMDGARFVPLEELGLPPSRLNPNRVRNINNHHFAFTAREMGRLVLTQTFRDLERNQQITPIDVHQELHNRFGPPILPEKSLLLDVIEEAYELGESLRYGSARNPTFKLISPYLIDTLKLEYNGVHV